MRESVWWGGAEMECENKCLIQEEQRLFHTPLDVNVELR